MGADAFMNRAVTEVTKLRCFSPEKKEPLAFAGLGMGAETEQGRCSKFHNYEPDPR
jgi:hypothetical protein